MKAVRQHPYHVAEQHVKTNTVYLLSIKPDANNMIFRIGNRSWTTFARAGLTIQIQLEERASWLFTATELLTQQLWALNREQGLLDIFNMLSWSNNFIWSYNTLVDLSTVGDEIPQHLICMLQQAIQYGGTQQLEFLPEATRTKIRMVLNKWHPLLEGGQQFQYFGVKTLERLRGSSTLATWLMEQSADDYLQQQYREPTGMEDNMEENDAE